MFGSPTEMINEERDYLDSLKTEPTKKNNMISINSLSGGKKS